ncbi:MAG: ScyD/ScyE family protein [Thermomicrobiales bacterium]
MPHLDMSEELPAERSGMTVSRRTALRASAGGGLAAAFAMAGFRAVAQEATPSPVADGPVTVAAKYLTNPRGFTWGDHGILYVALAGTGGAEIVDLENIGGPGQTGDSSVIAKIDEQIPVSVASGMPSTTITHQRTIGVASVAIVGEDLYVLVDANAMGFRPTGDQPDGVYRIGADGSATLLADTGQWVQDNPAKFKPADFNPRGEVFGMVADSDSLWVVESNTGQVLRITLDGKITRVADLSVGHPLPTGPVLSPNGGIYVGYLTAVPYFTGAAKVVEVLPDGTVTDVWTGLTMVIAVALDEKGTLYAAEMSTNNSTTSPYVGPATGRIVKQTGPGSLEEVATNINYPVSLAFGPDWALYVGAPAIGSNDADGYILRIETESLTGPVDVRSVANTVGGQGLPIPTNSDFGSATPADDAPTTPAATATSAATEPASAASQTAELEAGDFWFKPNTIEAKAGEAITVTVKNTSPLPHNFSIDALKVSMFMQPGESNSVTFTPPAGSQEFYCNLPGHKEAGMVGTLTAK